MAFEFLRSENSASPIEKEVIATNGVTFKHGCLVAYGSAGTATTTATVAEFVYTGKDTVAKTGDVLSVFPNTNLQPHFQQTLLLAKPAQRLQPMVKRQPLQRLLVFSSCSKTAAQAEQSQ